MASPEEISVSQLSRLIGTPACPMILDVRIDEDFNADPYIIPGAIRWPFDTIEGAAEQIGSSRVVVYCWKGLKLSQGAAAILRMRGVHAEILEGGHVAWREAGMPVISWEKMLKPTQSGQRLWVTRHRPKIDRIACPWLIRRFVDRQAGFLFVSSSQVENVAERFGATPFDIEDVFWSHRGEGCTFDTMVEEYGLNIPALDRLATIVRAADTNRHELAPEAAGLLAASLGLSRMYRDDLQQLEAGMALYDAFYRWARDAVDEQHDWPMVARKG